MSDKEGAGDRTEKPTAKRRGQARTDGMVPKSTELSQVFGICASFLALKHAAPQLWQSLIVMFHSLLDSDVSRRPLTLVTAEKQVLNIMVLMMPQVFFILGISALFGAGCTAVQTDFLWASKLLQPKFRNMNPIKGIKRIFSINNSINVLKCIVKLIIIFPIAYNAFFELLPQVLRMMDTPIKELLPFTASIASIIFWRIISLLFVLAIFDYIWQRYTHWKQMRMSKVEIKEERKAAEGDQTIKRRIIAIGFQRARQRMLQAVKTADVVVTNPTHYAVALRYSPEEGGAPRVVAKGRNFLAQRIKEIAKENGVPVIERKPLARALFASVEVGMEIPYDLFKAVAELLAYVYRLKGKAKARPQKVETTATGQTSGKASGNEKSNRKNVEERM